MLVYSVSLKTITPSLCERIYRWFWLYRVTDNGTLWIISHGKM